MGAPLEASFTTGRSTRLPRTSALLGGQVFTVNVRAQVSSFCETVCLLRSLFYDRVYEVVNGYLRKYPGNYKPVVNWP